jgi:GNAT superfamily N-acetyltransferase
MPDLKADLSPWHWGRYDADGLIWIWCYEEDPDIQGKPIPEWLLNLCITAREEYGCNWVLLSGDGDVIPNLPTYEHD